MKIELDEVSKVFSNGFVAADHIDLGIADGEFRVVLGPSGCGKSTVLRLVAGLEKPTTGRVLLDGRDATDLSPGDREVAFAFQQHALYPNMTVAENLGFPLRMAGLRARDVSGRVDEVARLLHLDDVVDQRPSRLSGGQQQRVSLGRSLIRLPRAFLMDEPLSNLDAHLRTGARSLIRRVQRRGPTTTVFVTHEQDEAMTLGDRITVMRSGSVVQTADPSDLYSHPVDLFTAGFVGSPPMNLFAGTVAEGRLGPTIELGSTTIALSDRLRFRSHRAPGPGREVGVGIRAEALTHAVDGELCASVRSTESHGSEQLVHGLVDAPTIVLTEHGHRVDRRREGGITARIGAGERIGLWAPFRLRVDTTALHLFDLETGRALTV